MDSWKLEGLVSFGGPKQPIFRGVLVVVLGEANGTCFFFSEMKAFSQAYQLHLDPGYLL